MTTMEFCDDHWAQLRRAVAARGLDDLVSDGGAEAASRQVAEFEDNPDWTSFDPLLYAMWNLLANGSRIFNRPLLLVDGCPICHLLDHHEATCDGDPRCRTVEEIDSWPDKAADAAHTEWRRRVDAETAP